VEFRGIIPGIPAMGFFSLEFLNPSNNPNESFTMENKNEYFFRKSREGKWSD